MITGVSTRSINLAIQRSVMAMQRELQQRQVESQTGMLADVGLGLGKKSAAPVSFLRDVSRLTTILDSNNIAITRLRMTQQSLDNVRAATQSVLAALTADNQTAQGRQIASEAARSSLETMTSALNITVAGQHIFSGLNSDAAPIDAGNGIPAGDEMDAAFLANFGFAKSSPSAASITPAAFSAFVTRDIEPLFMGAGWNAAISSASDEVIRSRISLTASSETSVSANEQGIRGSVYAAALAANFLETPLSAAVAGQIVKTSVSQSAASDAALAAVQSKTGFVQERLAETNVRVTAQRDLFTVAADDLTAVDPYATAMRLNALLTQIETSYALTQKIQNMSILRYLG